MNKSVITAGQYLAGKVRRWHTHHSLTQTNADHSHGVAAIIALMHPNPSANLLKAALFHDHPEYITGDVPSYAKQEDAEFAAYLDRLEAKARARLAIPEWPLTAEDRLWLEFADSYEALLFVELTYPHCQQGEAYFSVLGRKAGLAAEKLGLDFTAGVSTGAEMGAMN